MLNGAFEYQPGDRVRVLAGNDKVPTGTKGNVVFVRNDTIAVSAKTVDGWVQDYFVPAQLEQVVASTGEMERTRMMHGVPFAGTGTPEEMLEVCDHIRELIDAGHSYMFMERYMISMGYGYNLVRKCFKQLTGVSAEQVVNMDYQFSPGTIPQFTLGWGEAKDGDGYYFIMPGVNWYAIFHQLDDMNRVEECQCGTLPEAVEQARKLVKKLQRWDEPIKEQKIKIKEQPMDKSQLYQQPQLFMQAQEMSGLGAKLKTIASVSERKRLIGQAYLDGIINEASRDGLLGIFGDAEAVMEDKAVTEKLNDMEREEMNKPIRDEISEKTPSQFFEKKKLEHRYSVLPADAVDSVSQYLHQVNSRLKDFDIQLHSFKYSTIQPAGAQKSTPMDEPDIMNATASISVLVEVGDNRSPDAYNKKLGLMVFSVIRNSIFTTDTIKGEDDWIYALTDEGLGKYFQVEREMSVNPS